MDRESPCWSILVKSHQIFRWVHLPVNICWMNPTYSSRIRHLHMLCSDWSVTALGNTFSMSRHIKINTFFGTMPLVFYQPPSAWSLWWPSLGAPQSDLMARDYTFLTYALCPPWLWLPEAFLLCSGGRLAGMLWASHNQVCQAFSGWQSPTTTTCCCMSAR